ncbi:MAG: DEAD/DEAH box helicase [Lactobacillaceae bacterium]|jgi:ATP-dependent RNA helicase CshB|nr:DEAD/DEAH box helicase [Lactobacillaceae bacterium]
MATNQFAQFNLKPEVIDSLTEIGFTKPTKVQQRLIPVILSGRDVAGQSQTGSGKTHTFLIPIFNKIDVSNHNVQVVITAPSRELATQIYDAAKLFASKFSLELRISNFVGGTDKQRSINALQKNNPQIVIGTPGRILDLYKSGDLSIYTAETMVIDEADMTLDMGFLDEVDQIASALPKDAQLLVFSATLPKKLEPFLRKYMNNPLIEEIPTETVIADTIENWLIASKSKTKNELIYQLLTRGGTYMTIVFANTKERAKEIASFLRGQGLKLAEIHGDIEPRERKRTINRVKKDEFQYIVATDLAARGLDINGVSEVINDDIPENHEFFIHRVGRTGRNGMKGLAITIYGPDEENKVEELEELGIKFIPKQMKNGQVVDQRDRRARTNRKATTQKLDGALVGMIVKKKKTVKPGYKNQIKTAIKRKKQMDARIEQRTNQRNARKANKAKHANDTY